MAVSPYSKRGKAGYKEKMMVHEELLTAVRKVLSGMFPTGVLGRIFYGSKLGLSIARELGVKISSSSQEDIDRIIKVLPLEEVYDSVEPDKLHSAIYRGRLNCAEVAVDSKTWDIEMSQEFLEFLRTANIRATVIGGLSHLKNGLYPEELKGLYLDPIQKQAEEKFLSAKRGRNKLLVDLDWVKVLVDFRKAEDLQSEFLLVEKLISASKTQKKNVVTFCSSRKIIPVSGTVVAMLIISSCEEISKDSLKSLRKLCLDTRKAESLSISAEIAAAEGIDFKEWMKVITYAKKHKYEFVWDLLTSCEYKTLGDFQGLVEKSIQEKKGTTWPQVVPEMRSEDFVIKQITNAFDLVEEGAEQRHCVGGYSHKCERGEYIVLSVKGKNRYTVLFEKPSFFSWDDEESSSEGFKLAQFKGKFNQKPSEEDYWRVLNIIEENASKIPVQLVLPAPGTEMIW